MQEGVWSENLSYLKLRKNKKEKKRKKHANDLVSLKPKKKNKIVRFKFMNQ